ncbi:MAG: L,D-transpeptidase family protein [Chitinophagaceae bacterium]
MKRFLYTLISLLAFFLLLKSDRLSPVTEEKNKTVTGYEEDNLIYPALVNTFYQRNGGSPAWFSMKTDKSPFREQLLRIMDTAYYFGMVAKKYHYPELRSASVAGNTDSAALIMADRLFTDAAIALFKDIYQGYKMAPWVGYDELSEKAAVADNEYLVGCLLKIQTAEQLKEYAASFEPAHPDYIILKNELRKKKERKDTDSTAKLILSLNYYRWIHHFRFEQFIIVNLPAARLHYFEKDKLVLEMKTVVGKPSTPTPRFATVCNELILYPYWYVPRSITFNEYLPLIKKNPYWLDAHNMQVIDGSGKVMNHHALNWSSFHSGYFPYIIRQSTGCDNALGILKFHIVTPYGVYLHDTNNKTAFLSGSRFYSHGCIRLEEPIVLGNRLLSGKLDTAFLQSCFKEQKPITVPLKKPVPVFVVYMPAMADAKGRVIYYKDVYKLVR